MMIPIPAWHYNYYAPTAPGDPPPPEPGTVVPPRRFAVTFEYGITRIGTLQAAHFKIDNEPNDAEMTLYLNVTGATYTRFRIFGDFVDPSGLHSSGGEYSSLPDSFTIVISAGKAVYIDMFFQYAATAPLPPTFYPFNNSAGVHGIWVCKTISDAFHANVDYKFIP